MAQGSGDLFSRQVKNDDVLRWFAFGIIALAVFVSYYPTLYFPPRCDQVTYLAEIAGKQHPAELIFGTYDLNRHRLYAPGDELLFRPLLYMLLGTEQVLFGHHFWAWQMVGILAHLALVWILLRLLWHLSGPWIGFAGTWFFALSITGYELVSWPHLTGYVVMMALVLLALEQVLFCLEENRLGWGRLWRMIIYLSVACFIYETANLFTLCIMGALMVSFPQNRRRALVLLLPVVFYGLFSYYNYVYISHVLKTAGTHGVSLMRFLWSIIDVGAWWAYEGIFNGMYGYMLSARTMFQRNEVMVFKPLIFANPQVVLALLNLLAIGGLAWINRRLLPLTRIRLFALLGAMLFAYVAVIVVGRYQAMGSLIQAVRINTYYIYLFWVIAVLMVFSLVAWTEEYGRPGRLLLVVFVSTSLVLGLGEGKRDYFIASGYNRLHNNELILITTLDLLIKEKGSRPGFSFYVHPRYPGNYTYGEVHKKGDPPGKKYSFAELLYPEYFHPRQSALYKFLIKNP